MAHSPETKAKAALAWVLSGSVAEAARAVGLPKMTVQNWTKDPDWSILVLSIRKQQQAELDATLGRTLLEALATVEDRLTRGMPVLDKTGKLLRYEPLSAMEALAILNTVSRIQERLIVVEEIERGMSRLDRVVEVLRARGRLSEEDSRLLPHDATVD